MANAERYIAARPFGISLVLLFFLLCPLTVIGQSEQKQDKTEDTFVAQHRETMRKNPEGVSFTLRFSALKMKLSQFPKNTTFTWNSYSQDQSAAEQVFSELKTFLEENGMKLEKRKAQ